MDIFSSLSQRKKIIVIAIPLIIILVLVFLALNKPRSKLTGLPLALSPTPINLPPNLKPISPPTVKFDRWVLNTPVISAEARAAVYSFRTNFPQEYISQLQQKLQVSGERIDQKNLAMIADKNKMIVFNTEVGSFIYYNKDGVPLAESQTNKSDAVLSFIQSLGFADPSLRVIATYKKTKQDSITYYEIHRDWQAMILPVLNRFGLTNLPEDTKLTSLSLTSKLTNDKTDSSIYATSDNRDGYKRNDDFNTITVAVDTNNKVIAITSHMRPFINEEITISDLRSYDEALGDIRAGKFDSIITAPAGEGLPNWEKIYPQNVAEAKEAVVTDAVLAYIEDPLSKTQAKLSPSYIFRGYAQSKSGYRINFIALVRATKQLNVFNSFWHDFFKPVWAIDKNQIGSQHQGTFETSVTPTAPPTPTLKPNEPTPTTPPSGCAPTAAQIAPLQDWNGVQVGYFPGVIYSVPGGYYMLNPNFANENVLQEWINAALERHADGQFDPNPGGVRELQDIMRDMFTTPECPIRLTGPSPSLFIYTQNGETTSIIPYFTLTYADPATDNNEGWNITQTNKLQVNSTARNFIYYEYKPVQFAKPVNGWSLSREKINEFVDDIASQLQLTGLEKTRLSFEINTATRDLSSQHVYIGLIPQLEIDTKLPLFVSPNIDKMYRYHFYISANIPTDFTPPALEKIERGQDFGVEFGALTGN